MSYTHTQHVPKSILTALGAAGGIASLRVPGLMKSILGATTAGLIYTFRSLTVAIDEHHINITFGDWLNLKQLKLAYIQAVEAKRMCPLSGWGIHYVGDGWLYNVYGLNAVKVTMKSGKNIYIGTDQPELLVIAIREAAGIVDESLEAEVAEQSA